MKFIVAAAVILTALGTPALAQTADPMASVPAADQKKIKHCHAMAQDAMAKSATCAKMKKLHPAAFDYNPMVN